MKGNRIVAVGIVVAAGAWIASGHLFPHETAESRAAVGPAAAEVKRFRVSVMVARLEPRSRQLVLSGRTEAEKKMMVTARGDGIISELKVRRGQQVKQGDVIAVLSDEAREARVLQAKAMLMQRKTELAARMKLVEQGTLPKLEAVNLETQFKAAEAALAAAEAERDRSVIRAPWSGVVNDVPVEIGQAAFSFQGKEIAQIVSIDPILAVVEVAERNLHGIHVGDPAELRLVTGHKAQGKVRFISKSASQGTRTYRVEVEIPNADAYIPDGITCRGRGPARAGAGGARPALGADVFVRGRSRRAYRRCGQQGGVRAGVGDRRSAAIHVGRRRRRRRARDRAGAGLRARGPGRRRGGRRAAENRRALKSYPWAIRSTTRSIMRA